MHMNTRKTAHSEKGLLRPDAGAQAQAGHTGWAVTSVNRPAGSEPRSLAFTAGTRCFVPGCPLFVGSCLAELHIFAPHFNFDSETAPEETPATPARETHPDQSETGTALCEAGPRVGRAGRRHVRFDRSAARAPGPR